MNTAYKCDYYYRPGGNSDSSSIHKLDSLCAFSDAFYTCRFSVDFKHFQLLTPDIMRLTITLKMLNMTIKIIPGMFSDCKMTLVMRFQSEIVLFPRGKRPGWAKPGKTTATIARNIGLCSTENRT
jgi:hypothetical protein